MSEKNISIIKFGTQSNGGSWSSADRTGTAGTLTAKMETAWSQSSGSSYPTTYQRFILDAQSILKNVKSIEKILFRGNLTFNGIGYEPYSGTLSIQYNTTESATLVSIGNFGISNGSSLNLNRTFDLPENARKTIKEIYMTLTAVSTNNNNYESIAPTRRSYAKFDLTGAVAICDSGSKAPTIISPLTQQEPRLPIRFSWEYNPAEIAAADVQVGWQIELTQNGASPIIIEQENGDSSYILPANSLANYNPLTMRIRTKGQYSGWGDWTEHGITLGKTPPLAPILTFPISNITVPYTDTVTFAWSFNTTIMVVQGGFELELQQEGVVLPVISEETSENQFVYNTDGFIHNYMWRLRTWNELGDMGAWSAWALFNTSGRPLPPAIINVTNQSSPLITWGMHAGLNWQLVIEQKGELIFDSGVCPSLSQNEYRLPMFLSDGDYIAQLRTVSDLGIESEYSLYGFTLNTDKPPVVPPVIMKNNKYGVYIKLNGDTEKIIMRDDVEIARTHLDTFIDYTCGVGELHEYKIRNVFNFNCADSSPVHGSVNFSGTFIAPVNDLDNYVILEKQLNGLPTKTKSIDTGKKETEVIGRPYPLIEFNGIKSETVSLAYFILKDKPDDLKRIEKFAAESQLYIIRHRKYGVIKGLIESFSVDYTDTKGFGVSFSVRRVTE